jgi:hypothetical protein
VIQAILMRTTIHMVSAREYWSYAMGIRQHAASGRSASAMPRIRSLLWPYSSTGSESSDELRRPA